ncbi:MAG: hypothetical protein CMM01_26430 [Rhodopirellula sp.]|nr:hypothetical protein [Rhodopirellula sp.]
MTRFEIPAALLLTLVMASVLQAQNAATGNAEDPFDTSESNPEFSNLDRSGAIGATAATGAGFSEVSAATGGTTAGSRGASGGGLGAFGGGGFGGLGGLFNAFNNGGGQATQPAIRTRLRSAIEIAPRSPEMVQQAATERFVQLAGMPSLRGIRVRMEGRTAILTGAVATERERRISQLLVQLEPGVRKVENRIQLAK